MIENYSNALLHGANLHYSLEQDENWSTMEVQTGEWEIPKTGNLDRWNGVERCGRFRRESETDVILKWSESLQRSGYLADGPGLNKDRLSFGWCFALTLECDIYV
jgi:hypothetical protein